MRRKVLNVFEATELGNFCLAARFHTVCDDFILWGDLWGSPLSYPPASYSEWWRIAFLPNSSMAAALTASLPPFSETNSLFSRRYSSGLFR